MQVGHPPLGHCTDQGPLMNQRHHRRPAGSFRASQRIAEAILDYVGHIPTTGEGHRREAPMHAQTIARATARQAAVTAGSLTLPPGPLGWLTVLPELRALWRLQTQMVADIAGCFGKTDDLGREEMLYCLFRHTDPRAVRDLAARVGRRIVVQRAARPKIESVALKIAIHLSQRLVSRGVSRWIPVFGALGAGAYAYYDTWQVARTACDFFASERVVEGEVVDAGVAPD